MANFRYLYFIWLLYSQNYAAGIHVLSWNQATQKQILVKFSYQKPPQILRSSPSLEIPSTLPPPPSPLPPPPLGMYMWQFWTAKNIFSPNQQEQRLNKTDKEVVDSSYDAELFVRWES